MKKTMLFLILIGLLVDTAVGLQKNVAGQKIAVYAYHTITNEPVPNDGAQITATIWMDWASKSATNDTNPTPLDISDAPGIYMFTMTQAETNADAVHLYAVSSTSFVELLPVIENTTPPNFPDEALATEAKQDIIETRTISVTAAANLEDTYDGTGYADDNAPATQLQLTTVAGGVSVSTTATGINIDEPNGGEQTLTYAATASHDGTYHEVASDDANDDIDFYYTFNTGDGMNLPVSFHLHGYYEDNNPPANSTLVIQAYNFNIADWETIITLSDSATDLSLELPLHVHDVDPDGGGEGDVRIRFKLSAIEESQNMRIDHATVGYVSGGLTVAAIVDGNWNALLTGATYNIASSAGRRLREFASTIIVTGTSPDSGDTTNTAIRIELDGDASSTDGAYDPANICIVGGTGAGQSRQIWEYDGSNKLAYINRDWKVIPDSSSEYVIHNSTGNTHVNEGVAGGGGSSTITLNALASSIPNAYVGQIVFIAAGDGQDQARIITAYDKDTRIATVEKPWDTQPTNGGSVYAILPFGLQTLADMVDEWESQSQSDPTGFHINIKELDSSAVKSTGGNIHALPGNI